MGKAQNGKKKVPLGLPRRALAIINKNAPGFFCDIPVDIPPDKCYIIGEKTQSA